MGQKIGMLLALALAPAVGSAAEQAAGAKKAEAVFWPAAAIKWTADPAGSGVQTGVAWGDPTKGAYGGFTKFPAGMQMPLHHHTNESKGVIVSGTLVVTPEGGSATELGPGSYVVVPGGMKHTTTCKAGADCVLFGMQPGPTDMIPAAPPAKK